MPSIGTSTASNILSPSADGILSGSASTLPPPLGTTNPVASTTIGASQAPPPPELEHTMEQFLANRSVKGVMICAREGSIISQAGKEFEGEAGRKYALVVKRIVDAVGAGLAELDNNGDELKFMRLRTKRHELMISPGQFDPFFI